MTVVAAAVVMIAEMVKAVVGAEAEVAADEVAEDAETMTMVVTVIRVVK